MAQGAIQGAKYAAKAIKAELKGADPAAARAVPVLRQGFDGDGFAVLARSQRSDQLEFGGFIAWLAWLVLHLVYLVGFKTKITTLLSWTVTFLSRRAREPHHHRAAGVRAHQDRRAPRDRGVGTGHRKSRELESLALPRRQAAAAGQCECDAFGGDFGVGVVQFADACHRRAKRVVGDRCPLTISSATVRPSRAPSRRWSVISATASGWFSRRPRLPAAGQFGRVRDQQPVLLMRRQTHSRRYWHAT